MYIIKRKDNIDAEIENTYKVEKTEDATLLILTFLEKNYFVKFKYIKKKHKNANYKR